MDFTSDSRHSTAGGASSSSSAQSSDIALDQEDLRRISLLKEKERLISRRNAVLREIKVLNDELDRPREHGDQVRLQDLLTTVRTPDRGRVVTLDGCSDVLLELRHKFDSLPLLNMELRLHYIEQLLYPSVRLLIEGERVRAVYSMMKPSFEISVHLQYGDDTLTECRVADISESVKWELMPLTRCKNPTTILLGCYEFDRLRCRISTVVAFLGTQLEAYKQISLSKDHRSIRAVRSDLSIELKVCFKITFESCLPKTEIDAILQKDLKYIDITEIQNELIKEYGVSTGLAHLCKTCLNI